MWECKNCAGVVHADEDTCPGCGQFNPLHFVVAKVTPLADLEDEEAEWAATAS
jgi:hypothetical protein